MEVSLKCKVHAFCSQFGRSFPRYYTLSSALKLTLKSTLLNTLLAGYTEDAEDLVSLSSKYVKEFIFPCGVSPGAGGVCRGAA